MRPILALALLALLPSSSFAAQWQSSSVSALHGRSYELGPRERTILTFDHANGWAWGDNFFFLDVTEPFADDTTLYAEWQPRLSLGKITGRSLELGPLRDLLLASEINVGPSNRIFLLGAGTNLAVPGMKFVKANLYWRQETSMGREGWQLTVGYGGRWALGSTALELRGFADLASSMDGRPAHQAIVPQLLLDMGALGGQPGRLLAGVELQYWNNKFGVGSADEFVVQPMLHWRY